MSEDILMTSDNNPSSNSVAIAARNQLQQFCLLAKTAHGNAILDIIRQVLEAPALYVFGELLEMSNIRELKDGPNAAYYNTLNLFAYGTYKQYRENLKDYLDLTGAMQKKLQHLTLVSLAIEKKSIPYEVLLRELYVENVRHLEDLIIEAIYADIIHGKLFQNKRKLEVDYAQGRDIPPGYTTKIIETLKDWVAACDSISNSVDEQITLANDVKSKRLKGKERIEVELLNLRKALKTQITESEEGMHVDLRETGAGASGCNHDLRKKPMKPKLARPSSSLKFSK